MIVINGGIATFYIIQILPLTPLRSYSGMLGLSTIFFLDTTVLKCTCFQVSPACCNSSKVMVATKWSVTRVHNYIGTNSPYLWSETTENKTYSLCWGKHGIKTYPLYGIETIPVPSRCNKPWKEEFLTKLQREPSIKVETWDPVSASTIISNSPPQL